MEIPEREEGENENRNMNKCIAHLKDGNSESGSIQNIHNIPINIPIEQTLEEHSRETAKYSQKAIESVGLGETGYLAGVIHDKGKAGHAFDFYIRNAFAGERVIRGSVNHTAAAVRFLMENYHNAGTDYENVTSEILAIAAGSHHGCFDCIDEQQKNGFLYRKNKTDIDYDEVLENFLSQCVGPDELEERFRKSEKEIQNSMSRIEKMVCVESENMEEEYMFYISLLSRLVLSAVIEGDRSDTVRFMKNMEAPCRKSKDETRILWEKCLNNVETRLNKFSVQSQINMARRKISEQCKIMAGNSPGIYRLNVPTGSGKTLSGLRFALAHAVKHGKERIIFTAPLLSILEQNAKVIREYIGDDSLILEHHSNFVSADMTKEMLEEWELLEDTWSSLVIITTLVQLLNTMFSGKTTCIRRFHSLCDSIIVIDEVQTVPARLLSMFSLAVNFLTEFCGATVVLCSATQPCMEKIRYSLHEPVTDIVPYDETLWSAFRRTEIVNERGRTLEDIGKFAIERLNEGIDNILIICNKKIQANRLYEDLKNQADCVFLISAAMCMAHRKNTLERINAALKNGRKMICVSTQVIESGVDISFQCVIRLMAGMDSVVQSAGRCNRNGEAGSGILAPVYLIECIGEDLSRLDLIQMGKCGTIALVNDYNKNPEKYNHELLSDSAIAFYYMSLYQQMDKGYQDGYVPGKAMCLLDLLSVNREFVNESIPEIEKFVCRQAFKTAGELFSVFDEETFTVITPYGKGRELISLLCSNQSDFGKTKELLDEAKPYTVSLYKNQIDILKKNNALHIHSCGAFSLIGHYDEYKGFSLDNECMEFMEV